MKRIIFRAGSLRNGHKLFVSHFCNSKLGKSDRKAEFYTPKYNILKFISRHIFKNKLSNRSESNLFTVIHFMTFFKYCKSVVNCVSSGKSSTFKTNSAEQRVCLDNLFNRRSACSSFKRDFGFSTRSAPL